MLSLAITLGLLHGEHTHDGTRAGSSPSGPNRSAPPSQPPLGQAFPPPLTSAKIGPKRRFS